MTKEQAQKHNVCPKLDDADADDAERLFDTAMSVGRYDAAAEIAELSDNKYWAWLVQCAVEAEGGERNVEAYLKALKSLAKTSFDAYLLYVEHNRPVEEQFYLPRRRKLKLIAEDLQDLHDGAIKYYALSLPQRVGKTTIVQFYMAWEYGLAPNEHNLMGAHGANLTEKFYHALQMIMTDHKTYAWKELFPDYKIVFGGDLDKTIDLLPQDSLVRKRDFTTMRAVTIETGFQGSVEVSEGGFFYTDDLVSGLEEALNPKRLESKFQTYIDMRGRLKQGIREVMVGARWNRHDPIGCMAEMFSDSSEHRFRAIPALNENDESNFDFSPSNVGYSTAYYLNERKIQGDANWAAKFQQRPYDREGQLFPDEELKYYTELPDREWRVMYICDPAYGGGDHLSGVFAYIFGENENLEVYIEEVVFSKQPKEITIPLNAALIEKHDPYVCCFEAKNDATALYPESVDKELKRRGVHTNVKRIVGKAPQGSANKVARITQYSGDIKKFHFRAPGHRNADYNAFMANVYEFTVEGKVKHDDAPDVLALLAQSLYKPRREATARIGKRFF